MAIHIAYATDERHHRNNLANEIEQLLKSRRETIPISLIQRRIKELDKESETSPLNNSGVYYYFGEVTKRVQEELQDLLKPTEDKK